MKEAMKATGRARACAPAASPGGATTRSSSSCRRTLDIGRDANRLLLASTTTAATTTRRWDRAQPRRGPWGPSRSIASPAQGSQQDASTDALLAEIGGTAIYLVGMMGSGKSTVGKILAEKLSYRFFDTDDVIEKSLGATVADIFEENGEEVFRDIEAKVLQELSQYARSVISTGGGAVLSRENWGNMRHGIVVWLNGAPETLAARIEGKEKDNRPLLSDVEEEEEGALAARLEAMLESRQKFYEEADIVVPLEDETTGAVAGPEQMTSDILERLARAIQEKKREIEEKKDFKIEDSSVPGSMEVREPYKAAAPASEPKGFQKKKE